WRRPEGGVGWAIAPSGENRIDREVNRASRGDLPFQARGNFGQITLARRDQVWPSLQVPRILRTLPVDHPRMRRRNSIGDAVPSRNSFQEELHRFCVAIEFGHVLDYAADLVDGQGLVV